MFIKRLLFLVIMLFILIGCDKTVSSEDIIYDGDKDLLVIKNTKNKPYTGTIEHYDEQGLFQLELKVKRGRVVASDFSSELELSDLCSADYSGYNNFCDLCRDTTRVLLKEIYVELNNLYLEKEGNNYYPLSLYYSILH